MSEFEYFIYENFDADKESENPFNPRNFLGRETDAVISFVADQSAYKCAYGDCCEKFGEELVQKLLDGGVLRHDEAVLVFDCPIFLKDDAAVLHKEAAKRALTLVDRLEKDIEEIRECCAEIENGFSVELNLYHILCGMVFDGSFFEYLTEKGTVAVSRLHLSGLDYLSIIYEKCKELQTLSDKLLCSYNRLVNGKCSLQSFGDADGDRFDFYRFFRLLEKNDIPDKFRTAKKILYENYGEANKDALLSDVVSFIKTGECSSAAAELSELFGYTRDKKLCVPVYMPEHQQYISEIGKIVEKCLGEAISETLNDLARAIDITAVRHNVNKAEIANELYHILFGSINETLVLKKIVAEPLYVFEEGRYLKCIELY